MGKRTDIRKVLIIGSGPIIIGQACEFDYSGTQACKALRKLGYEIVLVNSNPATIMTDPGHGRHHLHRAAQRRAPRADHRQGASRRPSAQPGRPVGAQPLLRARRDGRPRQVRRQGHRRADRRHRARRGPRWRSRRPWSPSASTWPAARLAYSVDEAVDDRRRSSATPCVLRPAYTMGGAGGGLVYNVEELQDRGGPRPGQPRSCTRCSSRSRILGWEELELEVVRDAKGQKITVCFIENIDPMGVHTGDSLLRRSHAHHLPGGAEAPAGTSRTRSWRPCRSSAAATSSWPTTR